MPVEVRDQYQNVILCYSPSCANPEFTEWLNCLVSEALEESSCLWLPALYYRLMLLCLVSYMSPGNPNSDPHAVQQAFYPLSHLPSAPPQACLVINSEKEIDYPEARQHFDAELDQEPEFPGLS